MTHPRRNFLDVVQILRDWITDAESDIRRSTHHKYIGDRAWQETIKELKRNLPKAKKALRELTQTP